VCLRENRTSPSCVTHVTPRSVARHASQSDLLFDNGKYLGSARELMGLQQYMYLPIGRYREVGSKGSKAAEVQLCI
jgi:hypothetical protein